MIEIFAPKLGFEAVDREAVDYLIERHYKRCKRPFRCCQPRDLLLQVRNYCIYNDLPLLMKPEYFDFAAVNYFTCHVTARLGHPARLTEPFRLLVIMFKSRGGWFVDDVGFQSAVRL